MDLNRTALLLVDIQKGFDDTAFWGPRSNPQFEHNATNLLQEFRSMRDNSPQGHLIIHVRHLSDYVEVPLYKDSPGIAFQPYAQPEESEIIISKNVNSSFIGASLEEVLRKHEIRRLYVIGLTTDHCVSTTVRMAGNLKVTDWVDEKGQRQKGGGVFFVTDATAAHAKGGFDAELFHAVHAESLNEFATVVTTAGVLEALRAARHQ